MSSQDKPVEIPFIYRYLNAFSPVGQEQEGQRIWVNEIKKFVDEVKIDPYGTAVATIYSRSGDLKNGDAPTVVIEAHCDEIAWIITHIDDDGYIRVKRHGGSDNMIAPSKDVIIQTHEGGKVPGVFGWPAIHTRKKYVEEGPDQHELWIDVGLKNKEDVKSAGIETGCLVTFDDKLREIGDYWVGRSLDNKIGGYIILEVARRLHDEGINLPFHLQIINLVQEEVGLYGAKRIAKRVNADLALVHDVCHNTNTPRVEKSKDGDVKGGMGPCIEYTAQNHRKINSKLREISEEKNIPLQLTVGSYGNDTMAFFLENIPTAILATPLKYMHTTVEMAHKDDVANAISLYVEFLTSVDYGFLSEVNNNYEV